MTKKQVGEERVYLAHTSILQLTTEGRQDRNRADTWRQELMQRPWRGAPHDLLSLLSYRIQDHSPRIAPPTMGRAIPHQSLIKKIPYSQIIWRHFFFN